jgi:hypothetical protein
MANTGQERGTSGSQGRQQTPGGGHGAQRTRDHETIKQWAEERGGHPAMVEGSEILRIDFDEPPANDDDKLRRVSWDEFFKIFDDRGLEFLYQERTADGKESRFNKFVRSGGEDADEG